MDAVFYIRIETDDAVFFLRKTETIPEGVQPQKGMKWKVFDYSDEGQLIVKVTFDPFRNRFEVCFEDCDVRGMNIPEYVEDFLESGWEDYFQEEEK